MSDTYKKILIIKPSALGDIVMAMPAYEAIRKSFPEAKISWLVRPEFAPLLELLPSLDEIIIFDRKLLTKWWCNYKSFTALTDLIRKLKRSKFDVVVDFQGLFRTGILTWLTGCKKRFGMKNAREFAPLFYDHKVDPPEKSIHVADYYIEIAKEMKAQLHYAQFHLTPELPDAAKVQGYMSSDKLEPAQYVVLIPGSANPLKRWPAENFAKIADKIAEDYALKIVVVGTEAEKNITKRIANLSNVKIYDYAGKTNLPELAYLLNTAALVVANDTGPGHIAAALGSPLVMILGPSNPHMVGPWKRPECVVAIAPDDRKPKYQSADPAHRIEAVTVDMVYDRIKKQLPPQFDKFKD